MEEIEYFMHEALKLAEESAKEEETPVGAVIVKDGVIISTGRNRREKEKNALCHAEIEAINGACRTIGAWRLSDCDLYVTLEPCPMCAGAIINARIKRVIFGAKDEKAGSFGSKADLNSVGYNHKVEIISGICEEECANILSEFFAELRIRKKEQKI